MFALPDDDAELLGLALAPVPALAVVPEPATGLELELLDEHAASSTAAPTAAIPKATRAARALGL
jgi:hypothetical protein